MNEDQVTARPEWNRGGGDHDTPYRFGKHPIQYLHTLQYAHLLLWRSRLLDRELLRHRHPPRTENP